MDLTLFLRFLPYIIIAIAVGIGWWKANTWCNSACEEQQEIAVETQAKLTELEAQLQAARERATALALKWAEAINRVEVRYVESSQRQRVEFAGVRQRAGRIRVDLDSVRVRVPAAALGVLDDAARAANSGTAAAPQVDSGTAAAVPAATGDAETTLTDWVDFATKAAEAYADVDTKRRAAIEAALACHTYVGQITEVK